MSSLRRLINFQPQLYAAIEEHAAAEGIYVSEWIDKACRKALPREVRATIPEKRGRGRAKKSEQT